MSLLARSHIYLIGILLKEIFSAGIVARLSGWIYLAEFSHCQLGRNLADQINTAPVAR